MSSIVGGTGNVDPELLRARVQGLEPGVWREHIVDLVEAALSSFASLAAVDLAPLERSVAGHSPTQLWAMGEGPVSAVWNQLATLNASMRPLALVHELRQPREGGELPADAESSDVKRLQRDLAAAADPALSVYVRIAETVWAMSFMLSGEIEGFRKRVPQLLKLNDGWELVNAVQEHMGHVRAAVNAIATGVFASIPWPVDESGVRPDDNFELLAARELRSRVFALRDGVMLGEKALGQLPSNAWLVELQKLVKLVHDFVYGPAFGWLRAGDKRSFLQHQQGLAELVGMWSPLRAEPARREVAAFARYLEAMHVINHRECLVAHDKVALRVVIESLESAVHADERDARKLRGKALSALAEAQGRDSELDALFAQTLEPGSPVPVEQLVLRAKDILQSLGG